MKLSELLRQLAGLHAKHGDLFVYMNRELEGDDENFSVSHFDAEEDEGLDERIVLW